MIENDSVIDVNTELHVLRAENEQLHSKSDEYTLEILNMNAELNVLRTIVSEHDDSNHDVKINKSNDIDLQLELQLQLHNKVKDLEKELLLYKSHMSQHTQDELHMKQKHRLEVQGLMMQYKTKTTELDKLLLQCNTKINKLTEDAHSAQQTHGVEMGELRLSNDSIQHQLNELIGEKSVLKSVISSKTDELLIVSNENVQLTNQVEATGLGSEKAVKRMAELEESVQGLSADRLALVKDNNERLDIYQTLEKDYISIQNKCSVQDESLGRMAVEREGAIEAALAPLQAQIVGLQLELQCRETEAVDLGRDAVLLLSQLRDRDDMIETMQLAVEAGTGGSGLGAGTGSGSGSGGWPTVTSPLGMSNNPMSPNTPNHSHTSYTSPVSPTSPNAVDRLFTMDDGESVHSPGSTSTPIVYLEIGSHVCTVGVFNNETMQFDLRLV